MQVEEAKHDLFLALSWLRRERRVVPALPRLYYVDQSPHGIDGHQTGLCNLPVMCSGLSSDSSAGGTSRTVRLRLGPPATGAALIYGSDQCACGADPAEHSPILPCEIGDEL